MNGEQPEVMGYSGGIGAKAQGKGVVETRERLGGLLKYYHRRAA
jgi:hypothetical protein